MTQGLPAFDRVSAGFPGAVRDGRIITAPHFPHGAWAGFDLAGALAEALGKPTRVLNDAEVQGFGVISGKGLEMVLTLGTGAGTALFQDGRLAPHLEFAHHPVRGKKTYNQYVGRDALKKIGGKRWNKRVGRVIEILHALVHYDVLYIGGGNSKRIEDASGRAREDRVQRRRDHGRHRAVEGGAGLARGARPGRAGQEVRPAMTVSAELPEEHVRRLAFVREEMRFEIGILHDRINALISAEAFLLISFTMSLVYATAHWRDKFFFVPPMLSVIGFMLAVLAWPGVNTSYKIIVEWNIILVQVLSEAHADVQLHVADRFVRERRATHPGRSSQQHALRPIRSHRVCCRLGGVGRRRPDRPVALDHVHRSERARCHPDPGAAAPPCLDRDDGAAGEPRPAVCGLCKASSA